MRDEAAFGQVFIRPRQLHRRLRPAADRVGAHVQPVPTSPRPNRRTGPRQRPRTEPSRRRSGWRTPRRAATRSSPCVQLRHAAHRKRERLGRLRVGVDSCRRAHDSIRGHPRAVAPQGEWCGVQLGRPDARLGGDDDRSVRIRVSPFGQATGARCRGRPRGDRLGSIHLGGKNSGTPSRRCTSQPPWWTSRWHERHSMQQLARLVVPPCSHGTRWCTSHQAAGRPQRAQPRSRAAIARRRPSGMTRVARPTSRG